MGIDLVFWGDTIHSGSILNTNMNFSELLGALLAAVVAAGVFARLQTSYVTTGFVGVRSTFGAVAPEPLPAGGPYLRFGTVFSIVDVDVKPQVDAIPPIECSTQEGIAIVFPAILVYNQLPADRVVPVVREYGFDYDELLITAQVTQRVLEMCNDMTLEEIRTSFSGMNDALQTGLEAHQAGRRTGLAITDVVVHKPAFPAEIQANYDRKAAERTALQAEVDTQARKLKESQTAKMMVEAKQMEKLLTEEYAGKLRIAKAETEATERKIASESKALERKIEAESEALRIRTIAAANKELHTDRYLKFHYQEKVLQRAQAYYGEKLPVYVGGPLTAAGAEQRAAE